ncbi:hypothetical protein PR048_008880 [Dryococelus australis]|uniref:Uncharacterized protein n=1 Tax=Dryococelus australis TaxID=614101 RepID=A0ABQ9HYC9_9NEOP|nr:hypothetical protein PR048_008880 [Dryococelus australis]
MILIVEKVIRGGISLCSKRYIKVNNKYSDDLNHDQILKVDLKYLQEHNLCKDLPFYLENKVVPGTNQLISNEKACDKLVAKPNSKIIIKPKYGYSIELCYQDTDSYIYNISTEDFYEVMKSMLEKFDTNTQVVLSESQFILCLCGRGWNPGELTGWRYSLWLPPCSPLQCYDSKTTHEMWSGEEQHFLKYHVNNDIDKQADFVNVLGCLKYISNTLARHWESCGTMPLVGRFSRGSPVSPAPSFIFTFITLIGYQDLAVMSRPNLFNQSVNLNLAEQKSVKFAAYFVEVTSQIVSTDVLGRLRHDWKVTRQVNVQSLKATRHVYKSYISGGFLSTTPSRQLALADSWKGILVVRDWLAGVTWSRRHKRERNAAQVFMGGSDPAAPILADQQARPVDVRCGARQTHPRRSEAIMFDFIKPPAAKENTTDLPLFNCTVPNGASRMILVKVFCLIRVGVAPESTKPDIVKFAMTSFTTQSAGVRLQESVDHRQSAGVSRQELVGRSQSAGVR